MLPARSVDINPSPHVLLISHKHPSLMWEQLRADPLELFMLFQISENMAGLGGGLGGWGAGVSLKH